MKRYSIPFFFTIALLLASNRARGDLQITISDANNSATYTGSGTNTVAYSHTGAGPFAEGSTVYSSDPSVPSQALSITLARVGVLTLTNAAADSNGPGVSGHAGLTSSVSSITNTGSTADKVTVAFAGNNFLASNFSTTVKTFESMTNLSSNKTLTSTGYVDSGNSLNMPAGTALKALTPASAPGAAQAGQTWTKSLIGNSMFSVGQVIAFTVPAGGSVSFQINTQVTPEPTTLAAWVCGLGLIGLAARSRRSV